jgi:hypothetical protein
MKIALGAGEIPELNRVFPRTTKRKPLEML